MKRAEENQYILVTDLIPVQWDRVFSFDGYTSANEKYKTIGYNYGFATNNENEQALSLVFTKDNKVVHNIDSVLCNELVFYSETLDISYENEPYFVVNKLEDGRKAISLVKNLT